MNKRLDKEYLRPAEITAVFGIDKTTIYKWINTDNNFPAVIKPSRKITLINKKDFENYLRLRSQI
jgi:predicted DNA-binding transcriptional regulator AlpA